MENFTPVASLVGGLMIGLSAALLMFTDGKIAGISGIAGGLLGPAAKGDVSWRFAFLIGLIVAGAVGTLINPSLLAVTVERSTGVVILAGLLVGVGTRVGNGCTSGHGVCGLSRLSGRSLVATLTFITTAGVTVYVSQHLLGGAL